MLCRYAVVRAAGIALGWTPHEEEDGEGWSVSFRDTSVSLSRVLRLDPHQRINHFLGMNVLCRKAEMARTLNRMRAALGDRYAIAPASWILPEERPALEATMATASDHPRTLIVKPSMGCQGKGIFLTRTTDDLPNDERSVVQEYVDKPLLIDGFKFDLRVYVVVLSVAPLRVYLFDDGLVRICSQKYRAPSAKNLRKARMHLTNYAINKATHRRGHSKPPAETIAATATATAVGLPNGRELRDGEEVGESGPETDDMPAAGAAPAASADSTTAASASAGAGIPGEDAGVKRSIHWFLRWLQAQGHDAAALWARIADLAALALVAAQPQLAHSYRSAMASNGGSSAPTRQCFEILGLDVMVDAVMRPWLLEVNHSPSFTCDAAIDWRVKHALLTETLHMLCLRAGDERRKARQASQAAKTRLYGSSAVPPTRPKAATARASKEPEEARYRRLEANRSCMLWRILPPPGAEEHDVVGGAPQIGRRLASFRRYAAKRAAVAPAVARSASHAASVHAASLPHSEYPSELPWGGSRAFWEAHVEAWQAHYRRLSERYTEFLRRAQTEAESASDTPRTRPITSAERPSAPHRASGPATAIAAGSAESKRPSSVCLSPVAAAEARASQAASAARLSSGTSSASRRSGTGSAGPGGGSGAQRTALRREQPTACRSLRRSSIGISSVAQAQAVYSSFRAVEPAHRGGMLVRAAQATGSPIARHRKRLGVAVVRLGASDERRASQGPFAPRPAPTPADSARFVTLRRAHPGDDLSKWTVAAAAGLAGARVPEAADRSAAVASSEGRPLGSVSLGQVQWATRKQRPRACRAAATAGTTLQHAGSRVIGSSASRRAREAGSGSRSPRQQHRHL